MIDVRGVSRRFGRLTALIDATFTVSAGEIVALLGPNGGGKTTMNRIVAGILAPSDGDVLVEGVSVRSAPDRVRSRCGMVTDSPSLCERMTLRAYADDAGRTSTRVLRALLEAGAQVVSLADEERTLEEAYLQTIRDARA
ncbi:MAG: ATP-binding cassette domain-containing protein [Chloroflexi bacterium]|nr:ATP-binding cassette domain-containing protein [Chloroflexota bacterium]